MHYTLQNGPRSKRYRDYRVQRGFSGARAKAGTQSTQGSLQGCRPVLKSRWRAAGGVQARHRMELTGGVHLSVYAEGWCMQRDAATWRVCQAARPMRTVWSPLSVGSFCTGWLDDWSGRLSQTTVQSVVCLSILPLFFHIIDEYNIEIYIFVYIHINVYMHVYACVCVCSGQPLTPDSPTSIS